MNKPGTLYFMIGKMGAGKSTYSSQLSQETGAIMISEDDWLAKLYPGEINGFDDFLPRHKRILDILGPHVEQLLRSGVSVVLDFPANTKNSRQWFLNVANAANARHAAVYLRASNETCLTQIAKRRTENPERALYDTAEMFESATQYFEEPAEVEGLNLLHVARPD